MPGNSIEADGRHDRALSFEHTTCVLCLLPLMLQQAYAVRSIKCTPESEKTG